MTTPRSSPDLFILRHLAGRTHASAAAHGTFAGLGQAPKQAAEPAKPTPAVPVRKSVTEEFLISLEDGKRYQSLKRHSAGRGLTPAECRAKWGLPSDYPMVALAFSAKRSALAKQLGLGNARRRG